MKRTAHYKALLLQKKIFRSLQSEAELLLGKTPDSIRQYEKENQKDFRSTKTFSTKEELISSIRQADVTLIADYHTFEQAQRTALRIIREVIHENELWYIGLELVPTHFQSALDDFQSQRISEEEFHKLISYTEEWGFPWKHYFPIFEWSRLNHVRLIALNRPKTLLPSPVEKQDLHDRDQWAAGIITDLFYHYRKQKPRMIVLYGELHVGSLHIPHQIKKISKPFLDRALTTVSIHQNENQLYWKFSEIKPELTNTVLHLKKNVFCVFSSTPWAKLQSLVSWAEGGEPGPSPESEVDDLSLLRTYGNTIAEFLGTEELCYESVSTYRIDQTGFLETLDQESTFSREEKRLIRLLISENQKVYIPKLGIAFIGSSSNNGIAELAAIHLIRTHSQVMHYFRRTRNDFFRMILESTFGFFGSLILNPMRKCDLMQDHYRRIEDLEIRVESGPHRRTKKSGGVQLQDEKLARQLALLLLESSDPEWLEPYLEQKKAASALLIGARYLGQILGKKLHMALLSDRVTTSWITRLFLESRDYEREYLKLTKALAPVRVHLSKNDVF